MSTNFIEVHPAFGHADSYLIRLISALRAHPSLADITHPDEMEFRNNAWYVWDFAKRTLDDLRAIPVDLPRSHEQQWQEVLDKCMNIDGMINDVEGKLNLITGTYPHSFEFGQEEKDLSRHLAQGLLELEDDATGGF
ncbi:MAG: hypothetical protein Q9162_006043 [Coniocarpon cinnabarinum]